MKINWKTIATIGATALATASATILVLPEILAGVKNSIRKTVLDVIEEGIDKTVRDLIVGYGIGLAAFVLAMLMILVFPAQRAAVVLGSLVLLAAFVYNCLFILRVRQYYSTVRKAFRHYRNNGNFKKTVAMSVLDVYRQPIEQAVSRRVMHSLDRSVFPVQTQRAIHDYAVDSVAKLSDMWVEDRLPDFVPTVDELWQDARRLFGRRLAVMGSVLALYVIVFVWIIRPLSLHAASGLSSLEVYLYPFALASDGLLGTHLSE